MSRPTRVLVVEDNRLLREGIVAILDREPDFTVVAVAEDAPTALRCMPEVEPEVVLVDASLAIRTPTTWWITYGKRRPKHA